MNVDDSYHKFLANCFKDKINALLARGVTYPYMIVNIDDFPRIRAIITDEIPLRYGKFYFGYPGTPGIYLGILTLKNDAYCSTSVLKLF